MNPMLYVMGRAARLGTLVLLVIGTQSAHCQSDGDGHPGPPGAPADVGAAGLRGDGPRPDPIWPFLSFAMASEKLVKGAPYAAQSVSEFHQTLVDGNRIDRVRTTMLYRDGEGRTRQEQGGPRNLIFLNDAPAGRRYILDPQHKTALMLPAAPQVVELSGAPGAPGISAAPAASAASPGPLASIGAGVRRAWSHLTRVVGFSSGPSDAPASAGDAGSVPSGRRGPGDGPPPGAGSPPFDNDGPGGERRAELDEGLVSPGPFVFREPRGRGVVTSLGPKDFDSVKADGSRTTWTIPAGQVGNEKPMLLTSEQWYAPELFLMMYARDFDPRDGETIYQIKDLKRIEPPADLFKIPGDFTIVTVMPGGERTRRRAAP